MTENEQQLASDVADAQKHERMRWHAVYLHVEPEADGCGSDGNEPDVRVETCRYKADIEKFITSLPDGSQLLYVFQGHRVEFKPRRVYDLGERVAVPGTDG